MYVAWMLTLLSPLNASRQRLNETETVERVIRTSCNLCLQHLYDQIALVTADALYCAPHTRTNGADCSDITCFFFRVSFGCRSYLGVRSIRVWQKAAVVPCSRINLFVAQWQLSIWNLLRRASASSPTKMAAETLAHIWLLHNVFFLLYIHIYFFLTFATANGIRWVINDDEIAKSIENTC